MIFYVATWYQEGQCGRSKGQVGYKQRKQQALKKEVLLMPIVMSLDILLLSLIHIHPIDKG
jgi:hypothetical protein